MQMAKPYAESSEQNKAPIMAVLRQVLAPVGDVLEIGSGTGQHAVYFARQLPSLVWQPSDVAENLPGIELWIQEARLPNLKPPVVLDVASSEWPNAQFDAAFSANTAHIMAWPEVESMFQGVAGILRGGGRFCLYGPFNYGGRYSASSNERFDAWLKSRNPHMGVRDLDDLRELADRVGMELETDFEMPADNRTLVWRKL